MMFCFILVMSMHMYYSLFTYHIKNDIPYHISVIHFAKEIDFTNMSACQLQFRVVYQDKTLQLEDSVPPDEAKVSKFSS